MTRITTSFGFHSTATEVAAGIDLSGKRAIVTGASSGIGIETARTLAAIGAEVTLAVRDTAAGERAAADITASTGNRALRVARLDLADQGSVAAFVADWDGPLHLLVNNAGVMAMPEAHTAEGWEMQFATNHLGHFALAVGLHDALAAGAPARIVALSSSAHLRSPVVWDDIHYAYREYEPIGAYGQAKTANALFAVGASDRWGDDGITGQCGDARRHHHRPAAPPHGAAGDTARVPQDAAGGRRDLDPASPPRRCSTASADATSPTATSPSPSRGASGSTWSASRPTPWIRRTPTGSGCSPCAPCPSRRLVREQVAVDRHQPVDVVDVAVELGDDDRVLLAGLARAGARSPRRRAAASARSSA